MGQRTHQVEVKIDGERFLDVVTVETMLKLESGKESFSAMADLVSCFVWKDGAYMDQAEALELVKAFPIRQLTEAAKALTESAENIAVNPPNGPVSD